MMDTETEDEKAQLIKSHWGNRWGGDMENTKIQNGLSEIGDFIGLIFDGYNTNLKT